MEAIIIAGGLGTRLRQLVPDTPKPMAPIAGRPFLEILLNSLAIKGVSRVVLSLGFMAPKILSHFGNRFSGIDLIYSIENQPLGTGGAVRLALTRVESNHVIVLNGDSFLDLNICELNDCWKGKHRPIIVGTKVLNAARYGCMLIKNGVVTGFSEKGMDGPGLINAGCYLLMREQLNSFPIGMAFSLESDYLKHAVARQEFDVFIADGKFIDIGVPEDYLRAQIELSNY